MKKSDNEIIIYHIKKNMAQYSWKDLNCFYRVFAISLGSINDNFFDSFIILISLYITFIVKDSKRLSFNASDCVIRYYNAELKDIFGNEILCNTYSSCKAMKKNVYHSLRDNNAVIIPCDLFYLPYSKTYLEQHRRHYLIVKGINLAKNVVYVLDNMHNELGSSTVYSDFIIDLDIVFQMNKGFLKCFDNISNNTYYWTIQLSGNNDFDKCFGAYIDKICEKIKSDNIDKDFELQLYSGEEQVELKGYMEYVNTKILLYSAIKNLALRYYEKDRRGMACCNHREELKLSEEPELCENSELCKMITDYIDNRENFKISFVLAMRNHKRGNEIKSEIISLREKEIRIFDLFKEMSKVDGNRQRSVDKYSIVNHKNAYIDILEKDIRITLEEHTVYDIWKNCNDGVMIYQKASKNEGKLKVNIKPECKLGNSSNFGIVVILENGSKLLFGSLGRFNMAVHKIDEKADYELFITNYIIEEKVGLGMKFEDNTLDFYANKKSIFSTEAESRVAYCGIFAKTWENCFCDIMYRIEEIDI